MNMKTFRTPAGKAGCDQVDAMMESVHSEIEQMFTQFAKRKPWSTASAGQQPVRL